MISFKAILLLFAIVSLPLVACAQEIYPVSWVSSLALNSQADIEKALKDSWDDTVPFIGTESASEITVSNCFEYMQAREQGYEPLDNLAATYTADKAANCKALSMLALAMLSGRSYLEDFSLNPETIDALPSQVGFIVSEERARGASQAYDTGQGLGEFEDYSVRQSAHDRARIAGEGWMMDLAILARGDLNADGMEDLILKVSYRATQGTYTDSRVFVLTRTEADGNLRLVDDE